MEQSPSDAMHTTHRPTDRRPTSRPAHPSNPTHNVPSAGEAATHPHVNEDKHNSEFPCKDDKLPEEDFGPVALVQQAEPALDCDGHKLAAPAGWGIEVPVNFLQLPALTGRQKGEGGEGWTGGEKWGWWDGVP